MPRQRNWDIPDPTRWPGRCAPARRGAVGLMITEALNYSFRDPAALDFVAGLAESCEEAGRDCCWWRRAQPQRQ